MFDDVVLCQIYCKSKSLQITEENIFKYNVVQVWWEQQRRHAAWLHFRPFFKIFTKVNRMFLLFFPSLFSLFCGLFNKWFLIITVYNRLLPNMCAWSAYTRQITDGKYLWKNFYQCKSMFFGLFHLRAPIIASMHQLGSQTLPWYTTLISDVARDRLLPNTCVWSAYTYI